MMKTRTVLLHSAATLLLTASTCPAQLADGSIPSIAERHSIAARQRQLSYFVGGASVRPRWMSDGSSFWYKEGSQFLRIDPTVNSKEPMFDITRLRQSLTKVLGREPAGRGLPFFRFELVDADKAVRFRFERKEFVLDLASYAISPLKGSETESPDRSEGHSKSTMKHTRQLRILESNIWFRSASGRPFEKLTTDGTDECLWRLEGPLVRWSPDGTLVVARKVNFEGVRKIPLVDWTGETPEIQWASYPRAGGRRSTTELYVIEPSSKRVTSIELGEEDIGQVAVVGWSDDSSELLYWKCDRTFDRLDLLAADVETGKSRTILTETAATFLLAALPQEARRLFTRLPRNRFIWVSERHGWKHLYLYGLDGSHQRLTKGNFPIVEVVSVDEDNDWVYFTAHSDSKRPYDTHLCRVGLDGQGFAQLTEAPGRHRVEFSPSMSFFLDTHSTVDRAPTVELRGVDGKKLQTLSRTDTSDVESWWSAPEEVVVKAADAETDLWGVMYKPHDFDPTRKYPVIQFVYGGVGASFLPGEFFAGAQLRSIAQLGFIVLVVENRGTPERGKAFHDWSVGQKRRQKIADVVTSLKQVAATRPYMDLKRVGIFGASHGGYLSIRAILLAPHDYHVAVAQAGATDRRDNAFNERVMGSVEDDPKTYDYTETLRLASRLRGKLLLIHGTHDRNVDLSQTMKMVDALTAAGKQYDLALLPNATHYVGGHQRSYVDKIRATFFVEHLKPLPTIELEGPGSDTLIQPGTHVNVTARVAASGNAAVNKVSFQINGKPAGVDHHFPFRLMWTAAEAGRHVVTATVYDSNGQATASVPLAVFVGKHALERTIHASSDDAEERDNGSVVLDSFDLELVQDVGLRGSADQTVGLRFERITVPGNSHVTDARLVFTSWFPTQGDAKFRIHAELASEAGAIGSSPRSISSRLRTKSSISWSPSRWSVGETSACRTPDLSSLINEIVSLNEWESGNSVLFIITGAGRRVAKSFDLEPGASPRLFLEYTPNDGP